MIIPPDPIYNNMTDEFRDWTQDITDVQVSIGTGSPEGVVPAGVGKLYLDINGATGTALYVKIDEQIGNDRTMGWILV